MFIPYILIPWLAASAAALVSAPLGNLICWRRLVYFGETVAHSALLGIALSLLIGLPPTLGIWLITLSIVLLLFFLRRHSKSDGNTILGSLSHLALACGYIIISRLENIRTELLGYFFGDILATQGADLVPIFAIVILTLIVLAKLWHALLLMTVSTDSANAEIKHLPRYEFAFLLLLGLFIGFMAQFFGLLLVIALLIIPANTANRIARTPEESVIIAAAIALIATSAGIALAWWRDWPVSPSIVVVTGVFYLFSLLPGISRLLPVQKDF